MVTGVRADEYTKLTYLTFSGPVQVPGVTLPAGTYMFKLADPAGGRRAIQVWDEKGTKMYTMLLTIPDEQLEAKDEPVVLFSERPSGSPHAVKSWFYPAERIGFEFIYPKSQAVKIAATTSAASATTAPDATSANRTPPTPSAATPATTTAAARPATADADRAVGTSGSQAAQSAQGTAAQRELPRTASPLATIQLLSLAMVAGGLGVRQLRRRYAPNR